MRFIVVVININYYFNVGNFMLLIITSITQYDLNDSSTAFFPNKNNNPINLIYLNKSTNDTRKENFNVT